MASEHLRVVVIEDTKQLVVNMGMVDGFRPRGRSNRRGLNNGNTVMELVNSLHGTWWRDNYREYALSVERM
jgi:hypothetical protein